MDISVLRSGSFIVQSANRIYYFRCYKTWESFNSTKSSSKFLYGSPNSRSTLVLWFKLCFSLNGQSWGKRLLSMLGTSIWSRAVDVSKRAVPRLASLDVRESSERFQSPSEHSRFCQSAPHSHNSSNNSPYGWLPPPRPQVKPVQNPQSAWGDIIDVSLTWSGVLS